MSLGTVFIVASVSKLLSQSQFINEVLGYGLLPNTLASVYAIVLPWAELFAGCSLILGIFTVLSLGLCILMTLSFVIGNIYALSQGISTSCGCFGQLIPLSHNASLFVDILMVITAAVLLFYRTKTTFISIAHLLSKFGASTSKIPKGLIQKLGPVILIAAIMLAIGLPLTLGETTSPVYAEIDTSLKQGNLVFLYFYLEGCGECEKQKPIIDDLEQVYPGSISFIRVDYKAEASIAVDFKVTRVPTILLVDSKIDNDYKVLERFPQFTSKERLQRIFYEVLGESFCRKYGPLAEFTATPISGSVPVKVQFTDSSLGEAEWLLEFDWAWDFNNDRIVDSKSQHPSYIYDKPGTYTVSLTLSGPFGSNTITKRDFLYFALNESSASNQCQADFFADSEELHGATPIRFFDKSMGNIIAWDWDFDNDGTIDSTERNPTHTYFADGAYSVSLTIRTANCEDSLVKQDYITVTGCAG